MAETLNQTTLDRVARTAGFMRNRLDDGEAIFKQGEMIGTIAGLRTFANDVLRIVQAARPHVQPDRPPIRIHDDQGDDPDVGISKGPIL